MYAGQTLVAQDGYEVMLFPLARMYVTSGESHAGSQLAMDFASNASDQGITPYYAPCTCISDGCFETVVGSGVYDYVIWHSKDKVHTPAGLMYVCWQVGHDNNCSANYQPAGTELQQGDLMGYTGDKGTGSGKHLHYAMNEGSTYVASNGVHIYTHCYVNDTSILYGGGYSWQTYTEPVPTTYTVVLHADPANSGTVIGGGIYNAGSVVPINAVANSGYQFLRWSNGVTTPSQYITVNSNINMTAYFQVLLQQKMVSISYDGTQIFIQ